MFASAILSDITSSPPSRAAWIEIVVEDDYEPVIPSPPSRAAWIEISAARGRNSA